MKFIIMRNSIVLVQNMVQKQEKIQKEKFFPLDVCIYIKEHVVKSLSRFHYVLNLIY